MSNNGSTKASFVLGLNDGTLGLAMAAILSFTAVIWAARGPNVEKTDFSLSYVGAKLVHTGLTSRLYDIGLQKQTRDTLFERPSPLFFEHPPFEALLLSPLASFSYRAAYTIWGLLNASVWLVLMIVLRPHLPWPREDLAYIVLWFLFAPLGVALYQGQSSILLLAFYAASFLQLRRGSEFMAGALLGLGLLKFQFVLPLAAIFLFRKRWRFLFGFATTAAFLVLLSVVGVGWRGLLDYIRFLLAIGSNPQNVSYGSGVDMPTIHGLVYAIVGHWLNPAVLNAVVAGLSVFLLGLVAWRWTSVGAGSRLMFAAAISASLLAGSHMFTHDFSPMLLAMFIVAAELNRLQMNVGRRILTITLVVFWIFPVYFLCVTWHCLFVMCPVLLLFTWCAVRGAEDLRFSNADQVEYAVTG